MARNVGDTVRYYATVAPITAAALRYVAAYGVIQRCTGASVERALAFFQRWCRTTCSRLGLRVWVDGQASPAPCVYVANHRSYLDIPVLGGALGASFLSRADVAAWPVIGSAARAIGTVFIDREDPQARAAAARALIRRLRAGSIVVFPEGTTGGDRLPSPFANGLFRLLERRRIPIVPVTIRYSDRRAYWLDQRSIAAHLRDCVTRRRGLAVAVHIGSPLRSGEHTGASALASAAYRALCAPLEALGELCVIPADSGAALDKRECAAIK